MDILVLSWSPQCSRSYQKVYSGYSINSLGPKPMNVYSSRVPLSVAGTTCRHVSTASVPPLYVVSGPRPTQPLFRQSPAVIWKDNWSLMGKSPLLPLSV